jgi:hypothetical protein
MTHPRLKPSRLIRRLPSTPHRPGRRTVAENERFLDLIQAEISGLNSRVAAVQEEIARHDGVDEFLARRIAALEEARGMSPSLRDALLRILPVIAGVKGSDPFVVAELFVSSDASVRLVVAGYSPTRLGQLFAAGVGHDINGRVLERVGVEGHRTLWRIRAVEVGSRTSTSF